MKDKLHSMFSFFSKEKDAALDKDTLENINAAVHHFLLIRDVSNFKVYTMDYEDNPVVLIQAEPQRKLRFSNILEIQIKRHVKERLGLDIPAIFWRFRTDTSEKPAPEQADFDYEETPDRPVEAPTGPGAESALAAESGLAAATAAPLREETAEAPSSGSEFYDTRQLARRGMEVEEITMGEFDEFLKGATTVAAPDEPGK